MGDELAILERLPHYAPPRRSEHFVDQQCAAGAMTRGIDDDQRSRNPIGGVGLPPSIPPNIPYQTFMDWLSRVTVAIPDLNASAIITQASAEEPRPDSVTILFDIEITRRAKAPLDPEAMWTTLDQFRTLNNTIFEASLRDKAKELFP